jgi:hypothetical protein
MMSPVIGLFRMVAYLGVGGHGRFPSVLTKLGRSLIFDFIHGFNKIQVRYPR